MRPYNLNISPVQVQSIDDQLPKKKYRLDYRAFKFLADLEEGPVARLRYVDYKHYGLLYVLNQITNQSNKDQNEQ